MEWVELRQLAANELDVHEYGANESPTADAWRLWTVTREVCRLKWTGWEAEEVLASVKPEEIIDNDGNVVYEGTQRTVAQLCGQLRDWQRQKSAET